MSGLPNGVDVSRCRPGENRLPCPDCNRGDKDRALSLRMDGNGRMVWHCHRCGMKGASNGHASSGRTPIAERPASQNAGELSAWGKNLWAAAYPIRHERSKLARDYLDARRCRFPDPDGDLRFLPSLSHPCGYRGPALIALITQVDSGRPISLHRTWILAEGNKAPIENPRLLLKGHSKAGGVIRLWPDSEVLSGLGVAEGIETALSLAWGNIPFVLVADGLRMC